MRKHLFGLAIFISIITAAVFVYGYFNTPQIPVIPAVDYPHEDTTFSRDDFQSEIEYRILTAEADMRTRNLVARVELNWNGKHKSPDKVYISLFLWENGRNPEFWALTSDVLDRPFSSGNKFITTITLYKVTGKFRDLDNIYGYIDFAKDGKFPASHDKRISAAELVPILKVHD